MSDSGLSFSEVSFLVILMVEGKEVTNPYLEERYGVTLTGDTRRKLNDLKLVESRKQGRSFSHLLDEDGWARVAKEFENGIPMPRGVAGAMNLALVSLTRRLLARTGLQLNELPLSEETPTVPEVETTEPVEIESGDITTRIRAAYAKLADKPGAAVSLARLRPLLGDATREEVDNALKAMIHISGVNIDSDHNQKTLTPEARAAAVVIGAQDRHLISIGAR
ncbi:hypothetical protein ACFYY8_30565 [Streptosporangium sp. NPDC001559]|uniref:hypothetical protein n=1 Tax=Streptosporangium sp. NPDC001559 TaxID=3366187 RepID=UPI0036E7819E